jgi:hypothetical protein
MVFVNPKGCDGDIEEINDQCVRRIGSENPGHNEGQRVTVELRNTNTSCLGEESLEDINNKNIVVYAYDTSFSNHQLNVFSNNNTELSDFIESAHVVVTHTDGECPSIECCEIKWRCLELEDLSVPVKQWDDNRSESSKKYGVHRDVAVVQFSNYGLRLDGRGNPFERSTIELNGHDRLDTQRGSYYNFYQTQNHHTRTPADGINVYSFGLYPEKHQPSGTVNLSRIDNTQLNVTVADVLRQNRDVKLDIGANSNVYIYGTNYNILRIMSGMGGIAYSN